MRPCAHRPSRSARGAREGIKPLRRPAWAVASTWSAGSGKVEPGASAYACRKKRNHLYHGTRRVAFLKGVFRPRVLCEDRVGRKLWLATYSGVASSPLPSE